jgi:3-oxoacyl-[acyl-carrier-protein] synthase II
VITGLGLITSLATGVEENWSKMLAGECGIRPIQKFSPAINKTKIAAEVLDFNPEDWMPKKSVKRLDTFIHYALGAARQAWEMAGLPERLQEDSSYRAGCIMGVGMGGLDTIVENTLLLDKSGPGKIGPFFVPKLIANMAPGEIAMTYGLRGPNMALSTACAAGSHAIGEAFRYIRSGMTDLMVCGGAEAVINPLTLAGFNAARALSLNNEHPEKASRPFDKERDGFVMGEGSGVVILEDLDSALARGVKILAEVRGYGISCDAYHMTAPDPEGRGTIACMRMALASAGVRPEEVSYINAHGTSTGLNDMLETMAIKRVFAGHAYKLAVSSTKSMIGHMLGAAGGAEGVVTVLSLRDQILHPTVNYEHPDPDCDLDYVPNCKRPVQMDLALSNSFGFGGTNASLLFGVYK